MKTKAKITPEQALTELALLPADQPIRRQKTPKAPASSRQQNQRGGHLD